ncbi:MAG TPA: hypothetical protein GXZ78_02670 [Eubacteriaceae bacterium]|jgi:uncharacterized membrane protein|nr:hypothetical protein [Eubacteriaceae bacterium]
MINRDRLFQYGVIIGMIMLIIQGILIDKIGIPFLIAVNIILAIILVISGNLKTLIGLIIGYIIAIITFIFFVFAIYNLMLYFTKI